MNAMIKKTGKGKSEQKIDTQHMFLKKAIDSHVEGDLESAKKGYQSLIDEKSLNKIPYSNLASIYIKENRLENARELLRIALSIDPEFTDALLNLGIVLEKLNNGRLNESFDCYQKIIEIDPNHAEAYCAMGAVLMKQGSKDKADESYQRTLAINPQHTIALYNLGIIQSLDDKLSDAAQSFLKACTIDESLTGSRSKYWNMRMQMCDWSEYETMLDALKRVPVVHNKVTAIANVISPFTLLNIYDDPNLLLKTAADYVRTKVVDVQYYETLSSNHQKRAAAPIKIAFLSADFRDHATAFLMAELFELFDKTHFEIHAVSFSQNDNSILRKRIQTSCNYFHDVIDKTDEQIAQLIAELKIDIAIDLKGLTAEARPNILAYRPAPIQVNYLGYPGSMGAEFIDYIIADPFVIPEQEQSYYTEKIMYLPDSYQVNDRNRPVNPESPSRESCGLPTNGFVFCCFNNNYKIIPDIFNIWMELLKEIPDSVLWLLESNHWAHENLKKEAEKQGIDPERIIFAEKIPIGQHLARIQNADLFLDTFPCNAHTTASDALWVGLPLLTCCGRSFATRVAGSLLKAVDLEELITSDLKSYKTLALELTQNPEKLKKIKSRLKNNRDNCSLFDTERFKNNLQKGFRHMMDLYEKNSETETFYVSDLAKEPQEGLPLETTKEILSKANNKDALVINITIIRPQDHVHSSGFNEFAETLFHSFKEIGFATKVAENTLIDDGINIILGANLLEEGDIELIPDSSIIYNFEQIADTSEWITPTLFKLFNKFTVWDYSKKNIATLKEKGIPNIYHVPVGYNSNLTRIPKAKIQEIDILFYGGINQRRLDILNALKEAGLKVEILQDVYGTERDEYISRSKVIVNIHYYEGNIFEQTRVSYLLANNKAVVYECTETTEVDDDLKDAVALVPYDQIVDKCCELVRFEERRHLLEEKGFESIQSRNTVEYLNEALMALGAPPQNSQPTMTPEPDSETLSASTDNGPSVLPFISILTPSYNRSKYIKNALMTALTQNYPNFEIIVVDDGSTDNTAEIVNGMDNPLIKYIVKEHSGAPATRNRCLKEARGEYVLWLDSDDELMPDVLSHYVSVLNQHPGTDIIYGDLEMYTDQDFSKSHRYHYADHHKDQSLLTKIVQGCIIPNGGTMVRKELYNRFGGFDESFRRAHDYEFWSRAVTLASLKHSGILAYRYRWHDSNLSLGSVDMSFEAAIVTKLCNRFNMSDIFPDLEWANRDQATAIAWIAVGLLLKKYHDFDNAIIAFEQALKTAPDDISLTDNIANTVHQAGFVSGEYVSKLEVDHKALEPNPLVSVIVPAINQPDHLKHILGSLVNQSYENWEAIVVSDAGEDIQKIALSIDPSNRIQYLNLSDHPGLSSARNIAIASSSGSVICYLDSDVFLPEHIATVIDTLKNNQADFVYSKVIIAEEKGRSGKAMGALPGKTDTIYSKDRLDVSNYIPINTWAHRRNLLEKSGLFDNSLTVLEDWEMLLRFSRLTNFIQTPEPTVKVHQRSSPESDLKHTQDLYQTYHTLYDRYSVENSDVENERIKLLTSLEDDYKTMPAITKNERSEIVTYLA